MILKCTVGFRLGSQNIYYTHLFHVGMAQSEGRLCKYSLFLICMELSISISAQNCLPFSSRVIGNVDTTSEKTQPRKKSSRPIQLVTLNIHQKCWLAANVSWFGLEMAMKSGREEEWQHRQTTKKSKVKQFTDETSGHLGCFTGPKPSCQ